MNPAPATNWLVLTATLPTQPSGLRVRVWRALKATGAGTLREGVYLLPQHALTAAALWELERTIAQAGAEAHLLVVPARDAAQERSFRALFDRAELYAELLQSMRELRSRMRREAEASLRKDMRRLEQQLQGIQATDFFPAAAGRQAAEALASLRGQVERHLCPDEPAPATGAIALRERADFQGRTWATRRRPWVDRLGTAWLIRRFIDARPTFLWLGDVRRCPPDALGFDFDGATFTHVGDKVSFEVLAESFGLLDDPALRRVAGLVHAIDVGGASVDEAPGFELLMRGLQALHGDDDLLLAAALPAFDACHAAWRTPHDT